MTSAKGVLFRLFLLGGIILSIGIIHKSLPLHHAPAAMLLVQKSFFLPVILASFWFGLRGGLVASCIALLFYPHSMGGMAGGSIGGLEMTSPLFNAGEKADMVLLLLVGCVTGFLRESAMKRQLILEKIAQERDDAFKKLKESVEKIKEQERLAVLGKFSAVIAHEVRNPLYGMLGAVEILEKKIAKEEKSYFCITTLTKEIERLTRLTTQFLEYAKPKPEGENCTLPLRSLIEERVQLLKQESEDISCIIEGDEGKTLRIKGNADALAQLFQNLLLNAKEALKEEEAPIIRIGITEEERMVHIALKDNGNGMGNKERKQLFEPFFTTKKSGSGLGLLIVSQVIHQHGGKIEVESEPGKGSVFHLYFPLLQQEG